MDRRAKARQAEVLPEGLQDRPVRGRETSCMSTGSVLWVQSILGLRGQVAGQLAGHAKDWQLKSFQQ